jgi:hypothetical protein
VSVNYRRLLFGALGTLLVAAVVATGGRLPEPLSVAPLVALLENDYFFLAALGGAVLVIAVVVLKRGAGVAAARMPEAEETVSVPAPGDEFDDRIGRWRYAVPFAGRQSRRAVRERLRADAVEALERTRGYGTEEARRRVREGRWTDEERAAAFLAADADAGGGWLDAALRGDPAFAARARRTVDEITALADAAPDADGAEADG